MAYSSSNIVKETTGNSQNSQNAQNTQNTQNAQNTQNTQNAQSYTAESLYVLKPDMAELTEKDIGSGGKETGEDGEKRTLKRELTLPDLILMGLGNVVGAGVFVILGKSILYGGNKTMHAFIGVALLSIVMGFCYLEIYSRYKSDTTEYLAVKHTMGDGIGKLSLYMIYLFAVLSAVTIISSLAKYVSRSGYFSTALQSKPIEIAFALTLVSIMCFINYMGIHVSKLVANSIGIIMLIVLGGIVVFGAKHFCVDKIVSSPSMPTDSIVLSAILSLFLFNGYDFIVKISDETINPEDNKSALIYTLLITTAIYISVIIAGICILKFNVASKTYNIISKMYEAIAGPKVALAAYIAGAFIMFNTAFLSLMSASRFIYGCGKTNSIGNADFWKVLSEHDTPTNAIIVTFIITLLFSLLHNEVILTVLTNFSAVFILILISLSVLILRWRERDNPKAQAEHNYIMGNINNIPVIVLVALCGLFYIKYKILKHGFWINEL